MYFRMINSSYKMVSIIYLLIFVSTGNNKIILM
jgi:hypothetical protein